VPQAAAAPTAAVRPTAPEPVEHTIPEPPRGTTQVAVGPDPFHRSGLRGALDRVAERLPLTAFWVLVLAGLAALVTTALGVGGVPDLVGGAGAVAVSTAYAWALAARTGGRASVFGGLTLVLGVVTLVTGAEVLRTGAAVLTCALAAVLGVMVTVPAPRFVQAAREAVVALLVASVGAFAVVGWQPEVVLVRFEYTTLAMALLGTVALVHRLGAGLHGLGRRGVLAVLVGTGLLGLFLLYAELLRRYGTPGLVENLVDAVRWSRENLGASPRPISVVLGVPALVWGTHMRARRRQGWWVTAFGVAATVRTAQGLVYPDTDLGEAGLSVVYSLLLGLLVGYAVVRADLALTGPRGTRARRAEEATAVRPEPRRTRALL